MKSNSSRCLVLATAEWMPFIIYSRDLKNPKIIGGTMVQVFDILSKYIGFCYRFQPSKDLAGGAKLPNGSWTGAIGDILREKADMTGLALTVTKDRNEVLDISWPLYQDEWTAAYVRPVLESDVAGFMKPYTMTVWLSVMVAVWMTFVVSYFVRRIHGYIGEKRFRQDADKSEFTTGHSFVNEAVMWTLASLLAQAVPRKVVGGSVRIITGLWLMVSLIVAGVYRSNLKAMLILPKFTLPFDNVDQLVETNLPVWVPTDSVMHVAAKHSPKNTSVGRLYDQFVGIHAPTDVPWAVGGLISGDFALCAPRSAIVRIIHTSFSKMGHCANYIMSEGMMKTTIQSLIFRKGSPLKAKFDKPIMYLKESGILDQLYKMGVVNATECLKPISSLGSSAQRPMDLGDFYGVFFIYAAGIFIGLLTFSLELITTFSK